MSADCRRSQFQNQRHKQVFPEDYIARCGSKVYVFNIKTI